MGPLSAQMLRPFVSLCPASVQWRHGDRQRGQPGAGAAGAVGEAELRAGPDEGAHVLPGLAGVRGGAGAGDSPQGSHQVRGDEQQVPERHQGGGCFADSIVTHLSGYSL